MLIPQIAGAIAPSLLRAAEIAATPLGSAYMIYLHGSRGQTLGKMLAQVRVIGFDGTELGFLRATWRETPNLVIQALLMAATLAPDSLVLGAAIGVVSLAWVTIDSIVALGHPQRRALHDLIASSIVIRLDSALSGPDVAASERPL